MGLNGELFRYHEDGLVAFKSHTDAPPSRAVIYVAGLGDGFLQPPYVESLAGHLSKSLNVCLIQPLLHSSGHGFGFSSLDKDRRDLAQLLAYTTRHFPSIEHFVLMGHSSGCQSWLTFLEAHQSGAASKPSEELPMHMLRGVVLQGAASDRQYFLQDHLDVARMLEEAEKGSDKEAVMPSLFYGQLPVTPRRLIALLHEHGEDDFFSVDDEWCVERTANALRLLPVLFVMGAADECVRPEDKPRWRVMVERVQQRLQRSSKDFALEMIENGTHGLESSLDALNDAVGGFLQRVAP